MNGFGILSLCLWGGLGIFNLASYKNIDKFDYACVWICLLINIVANAMK